MASAGKIILLVISLAITIFFANYTYQSYRKMQEAKDNCWKTRNDYIKQYGELPEQYKYMCENSVLEPTTGGL